MCRLLCTRTTLIRAVNGCSWSMRQVRRDHNEPSHMKHEAVKKVQSRQNVSGRKRRNVSRLPLRWREHHGGKCWASRERWEGREYQLSSKRPLTVNQEEAA